MGLTIPADVGGSSGLDRWSQYLGRLLLGCGDSGHFCSSPKEMEFERERFWSQTGRV